MSGMCLVIFMFEEPHAPDYGEASLETLQGFTVPPCIAVASSEVV